MKDKETLEEVAEKAYLSRLEDCLNVDFEDGVKLGAKHQQERSYSEEEVLELIQFLVEREDFEGYHPMSIFIAQDFLNEFKKK